MMCRYYVVGIEFSTPNSIGSARVKFHGERVNCAGQDFRTKRYFASRELPQKH